MKKRKYIASVLAFFMFSLLFSPNNVNASESVGEIEKIYNEYRNNNNLSDNNFGFLIDSTGKKVEVPVYVLPHSKNNTRSKNGLIEESVTCVYALDKSMFDGKNKARSSSTVKDDDGTYVYGTCTITYSKLNPTTNYQTRYLLTKVIAKWEVKTSQISLSNRRVAYTCQSLQYPNQTTFKNPTSNSESYNTGYNNYSEDVVGSWVAAQMNVTCNRGTGKWKFDLHNTIINNTSGLESLFNI